MVGNQQLDQVYVAVGQELVEVGVDFRHAPRLCALFGQLPVGVANSDDAGVLAASVAHLVEVGDPPTANDSDAERVHAAPSLSSFVNTALCVRRVIGYQINSGSASAIARAGISPKNSRMPSSVCDVCATFGM